MSKFCERRSQDVSERRMIRHRIFEGQNSSLGQWMHTKDTESFYDARGAGYSDTPQKHEGRGKSGLFSVL